MLEKELSKNQDILSRERMELELLRRRFLEDMEYKLQQKLEDWEHAAEAIAQKTRPISPGD